MDGKKFSKLDNWTIETLIDSLSEDPGSKDKVEVPKYQRNLVWSQNQKQSFIDSIKSGFPFGSLLLYKEGSDENGITNYSLIDGLQRTTTIDKYTNNPTQFFSKENINEEFVDELINFMNYDEDKREIIIKIIIDWIHNLKGFTETNGYSSYKLAKYICNEFEIDNTRLDDLVEIIIPFIEKVKSDSDISKVEIPVIIYSGPESNLPIIFERINSKGTQLNKYQIYAATWSREQIKINNTEIIDFIKAKYDSLIDEGLQINNYDPTSRDFYKSDFNIFEYVFGLGKYLSKHYPDLFGKNNSEDSTESIGFNLCTMCLKGSLKEMPELPSGFKNIDLDEFFDALIESIDLVYASLKPYILLKANKKNSSNNKVTIYNAEYQIVSFIAKVFKSKYDFNLKIKDDWEEKKNSILKNLPYHYLYDILRGYWKGSGDSKLKKLIDGDRYENKLYKENWDNNLDEWFSYQLDRNEKKRVAIKDPDILFLKYIYSHIMTSFQDLSNIEFEIEHLVPINRLKNIVKGDDGLPMGAVSNLCLISKDVNRNKKDFTIYEYFDKQVEDNELTEDQSLRQIEKIEKFSFTKRKELNFVKELDRDDYLNFINERFKKLKQKFYDTNKIEEK